jgi:hypothetical protein
LPEIRPEKRAKTKSQCEPGTGNKRTTNLLLVFVQLLKVDLDAVVVGLESDLRLILVPIDVHRDTWRESLRTKTNINRRIESTLRAGHTSSMGMSSREPFSSGRSISSSLHRR